MRYPESCNVSVEKGLIYVMSFCQLALSKNLEEYFNRFGEGASARVFK
jgi:hypothetical protein